MAQITIFFTLIIIGYLVGQALEKKHYKSIAEREQALVNLVTTSSKRPVGKMDAIVHCELVRGNVVVSIDYFKRFVAILRNLVGGNVRSYETLIDRGRREAILRLKESCPGATQIINLRIETSSIYKGEGNQLGSVEVLAYATALYSNEPI